MYTISIDFVTQLYIERERKRKKVTEKAHGNVKILNTFALCALSNNKVRSKVHPLGI